MKLSEVQKGIIVMLLMGAAFLGGTLFEMSMHRDKELAVAGTIPVLTLDMVDARAVIYVDPRDPIYFCAKEAAYKIASKYFAKRLMHQPSKIWLVSRDMTRSKCGRPITILINVGKLKTEQ